MIGVAFMAAAFLQDVDFEKEVLPILKSRCFSCHASAANGGPERRPKGKFRLDSADWMRHGVNGRDVLGAGKAQQSSLYDLITLPKDDADLMPPDDGPLPQENIELLERWLDQGAPFDGWIGEAGTVGPSRSEAQGKDSRRELPPIQKRWWVLAEGLRPLPPDVLQRFAAQAKATIKPVAEGHPLLRVGFVSRRKDTTDAQVKALLGQKERIAVLDLARTSIQDQALDYNSGMNRLTQLDLSGTKVSSEGLLGLTSLVHLEVLNLHRTQLDSKAIRVLATLRSLKSLYLWEANLSKEDVEQLRRLLPETRIVDQLILPPPAPAEDA